MKFELIDLCWALIYPNPERIKKEGVICMENSRATMVVGLITSYRRPSRGVVITTDAWNSLNKLCAELDADGIKFPSNQNTLARDEGKTFLQVFDEVKTSFVGRQS